MKHQSAKALIVKDDTMLQGDKGSDRLAAALAYRKLPFRTLSPNHEGSTAIDGGRILILLNIIVLSMEKVLCVIMSVELKSSATCL
jgi:hypothetical protein